ncbi:hypothetical protein HD553DRAFT_6064 [Filobasidium floriforme]|uniref:uncharacterized protein n=1 Tax=Filobasidium floriforme TaxID=5210 RepID=UPI001E8E6914|nr:uncharacterized protein HD553DRAFT_6064 [Filobasidium floriforme]KAH8090466.1 hypothetical protein HD553DRAFT_6064 [Filobasidium floriforme]
MMGPEAMGVQPINVDWWDPKVCKNFICGTCPHDIFGNTKMDLGPCPRLHSEKVAKSYKEAKLADPLDPRFAAFEQEYQNSIYNFIDDCDRKIRISQKRLEKTPEENKRTVDLMKEVGEIELAIQGSTDEVEALGEAGKIEESMAKLEAVEALKQEKTDKERELQRLTETGGASGHQKLRVCETCGAYLSVLDSDRRLADHFGGKMHLGYHELRKLIDQFNEQRRQGQAARYGPPPIAPGPGGPPPPSHNNLAPPSGPSGPRGYDQQPHTPTPHSHGSASAVKAELPYDGDSIVPGHGDKRKREAHELSDAIRENEERDRKRHRSRERSERDRYESRGSDRGGGDDRYDRERRHRDRSRERSRRDDDRDYRRSDRDRERDRERESKRDR